MLLTLMKIGKMGKSEKNLWRGSVKNKKKNISFMCSKSSHVLELD